MKSLYARYVEEIEKDTQVNEFEWGFYKYSVNSDNIYIADLYVLPEFRGLKTYEKVGDSLASEALKLQLSYLTTTVATSTKYATQNLRKYIDYGFTVYKTDERFIYMFKKLEVVK